jgi:hypothetical protein
VTGGYALAARKAGAVATEPQAELGTAPYSETLLGYLLGRAHYQFMAGFRRTLSERQPVRCRLLRAVAAVGARRPERGRDRRAHRLHRHRHRQRGLAFAVDRGLLERSLAPDARYR